MPVWTEPSNDDVVVAHIADLHWGNTDFQEAWDNLVAFLTKQVRPHYLLVTGDLVDSPSEDALRHIRSCLDGLPVDYLVCAGNHDRFPKGTKFGWRKPSPHFDAVFEDRVCRTTPHTIRRTSKSGSKWCLGVAAVDTATRSDGFARGYAPSKTLDELERAVHSCPDREAWDLAVLLVHHHPQSSRAVEEARQGKVRGLFEVMALVNAGTFLERTARLGFDVVLHGREHATHWSRYGSLEGERCDFAVLGAGSATGAFGIGSCDVSRACLNLLLLRPDRAVDFAAVHYGTDGWQVTCKLSVARHAEMRRRQAVRKRVAGRALEAEAALLRHARITRSRDTIITRVHRNIVATSAERSLEASWAVGGIREVGAEVVGPDGSSTSCQVTVTEVESPGKSRHLSWRVPENLCGVCITECISYRTIGNAVLTDEDLQCRIRDGAAARLEQRGLAFQGVVGREDMMMIDTMVSLPEECDPGEMQAIVWDSDENEIGPESSVASSFVRRLGPGCYALRVPIMRAGWTYLLAWRPPRLRSSAETSGWQEVGRERGDAIVEAVRAGVVKECGPDVRVSLLVRSVGSAQQSAEQVAGVGGQLRAVTLSLRGDLSDVGRSFWGESVVALRGAQDEIGRFEPDECAMLMVPLVIPGGEPCDPWSVLRVGVRDPSSLLALELRARGPGACGAVVVRAASKALVEAAKWRCP